MDAINTYESFKYHWYIWTVIGFNPPRRFKFLYIIYSILINLFLPFYYTLAMIVEMFFLDDIRAILQNLIITTTVLACHFKTINVVLEMWRIRSLQTLFAKLDTYATDFDQKSYLKLILTRCHHLFKAYASVFGLVWLSSEACAWILTSQERLLYPAWFPFDWRASKGHFLAAHFYQTVGTSFLIFVNLGNDTLIPVLVYTLTGHKRVLAMKIKRIGKEGAKSEEEHYQDLVNCIQNYQITDKAFKNLQQIISFPIFLQVFTTAVVICLSAVYAIIFSNGLVELVYFGVFFVAVTMEILFYCYFSNDLTLESAKLTTHLYSCNWTERSQKFKRVLISFMQRSQKSDLIMAMHIIPVSLETFVSVMKFAYSLFALLREQQHG